MEENKTYSVPDFDSIADLDFTGAENEIKNLHSACHSDENHPYMSKSHPLHQDYTKYVAKLYEVRARNQPATEFVDEPLERRKNDANLIIDELVRNYGYSPTELPDNFQPCDLKGIEQILLCEKGEFGFLKEQLAVDIRQLGTPHELETMFNQFYHAPNESKKEIAINLINKVLDEKKKRDFRL